MDSGPTMPLQETLDHFDLLMDRMPIAVAFCGTDQRLRVANQLYRDFFDLTPAAIDGTHLREVIGEECYEANVPSIRKALAGEKQVFDRTLVDSSGHVRRTRATYLPEHDGSRIVGFFVALQDTTTEAETRRQLDITQALAKIGNFVYYPLTGEVVWSPEMFRLIEADARHDTPSLQLWQTRIHPDERAEVVPVLDRAFWRGEHFALSCRLLLPSGEERLVRTLGRPFHNANGDFVRMSGTVQDETELHEVTAELRKANAELEDTNQLMSDLITTLAHDVRQPIQSTLGFVEYTLDSWDELTKEDRIENFRRAVVAGRRLHALVDNILALMNVESGLLSTRTVEIPLAEEIPRILADAGPDVALELAEGGSLVARADRFHLDLVLTNLVGNARHYGEPPVTVQVARNRDRAEIRVTDRGEGVPEDFVPRLFDRFSRADSGVAATQDGHGFGLYIAHRLAEANGGSLGYRKNLPRGSCFVLTLPLVEQGG